MTNKMSKDTGIKNKQFNFHFVSSSRNVNQFPRPNPCPLPPTTIHHHRNSYALHINSNQPHTTTTISFIPYITCIMIIKNKYSKNDKAYSHCTTIDCICFLYRSLAFLSSSSQVFFSVDSLLTCEFVLWIIE